MRPFGHDPFCQLCGERPDRSRPFDDAGRRPLQVLLMRFGPMFRERGVLAQTVAARMGSHALALIQDFHRRPRVTDVDLFGQDGTRMKLNRSTISDRIMRLPGILIVDAIEFYIMIMWQ